MAIWSLGYRHPVYGSGVPNVYELQAAPGCSARLIEVGIPGGNQGTYRLRACPRADPQGLVDVALRFPFTKEDGEQGLFESSPVICLVPVKDSDASQWRRDTPFVANHRAFQKPAGQDGFLWTFPRGLVINQVQSIAIITSGNYTSDVWFVAEA